MSVRNAGASIAVVTVSSSHFQGRVVGNDSSGYGFESSGGTGARRGRHGHGENKYWLESLRKKKHNTREAETNFLPHCQTPAEGPLH